MAQEFNKLNRQKKEAFFMLPILTELKRLGGQASYKEIKRSLVANCKDVPEDTFKIVKISRNGNEYHVNDFPFNFSIINLVMAGYVKRAHPGIVSLTEKGRNFQGSNSELSKKVYAISSPMWDARVKHNKKQKEEQDKISIIKTDINSSATGDDWHNKLLSALEKLSSGKFEMFCRALVRKMNVDIDENIGVKQSGDGGVDGYGYMITDDFRTTRVAIQAKKWNQNHLVSSPEIDKFRGAMDKYRAEYGIFITTSSFTRGAIHASRTGSRVITLIDGEQLTDLIAKYKLYVKPIVTYDLGDFFKDND